MSNNYHFHIHNFVHVSHSQIKHDQSQHHLTKSLDHHAVENIVDNLQRLQNDLNLKTEEQDTINTEVKTILAQLNLPKPRESIIKGCLHSILDNLGSAAGNILTADLMVKIHALLGIIK